MINKKREKKGSIRSAKSYNKVKTHDFDHLIPKWDITLDELQEIYDKARFDRYLVWKITYPQTMFCSGYKKEFKRRIPWLYPDNGKYKIVFMHFKTIIKYACLYLLNLQGVI